MLMAFMRAIYGLTCFRLTPFPILTPSTNKSLDIATFESHLSLIDLLAQSAKAQGIEKAFLLASEGTIASGIYQDCFSRYGISVQCADDSGQVRLREFIEAVKQDKITDDVKHDLSDCID